MQAKNAHIHGKTSCLRDIYSYFGSSIVDGFENERLFHEAGIRWNNEFSEVKKI